MIVERVEQHRHHGTPASEIDARRRRRRSRVAELRKARDLTQAALARRAGVSVSLLSKIEIGDRTLPPTIAAAIARALPSSRPPKATPPNSPEPRKAASSPCAGSARSTSTSRTPNRPTSPTGTSCPNGSKKPARTSSSTSNRTRSRPPPGAYGSRA
ncbi:MAG: helix-turn-helix domain-containing protein [Pseudonocardia sp.]